MAAKYLTMVGQLQWLVTLGRFDFHAQVATMSRFRVAPRQGHMGWKHLTVIRNFIQLP